jgi:hypothetical protein
MAPMAAPRARESTPSYTGVSSGSAHGAATIAAASSMNRTHPKHIHSLGLHTMQRRSSRDPQQVVAAYTSPASGKHPARTSLDLRTTSGLQLVHPHGLWWRLDCIATVLITGVDTPHGSRIRSPAATRGIRWPWLPVPTASAAQPTFDPAGIIAQRCQRKCTSLAFIKVHRVLSSGTSDQIAGGH